MSIEPMTLTANQVVELLQISKAQFHRLRNEGRLPQPVQFGKSRAPRWLRKEFLAWIDSGCAPAARPESAPLTDRTPGATNARQ